MDILLQITGFLACLSLLASATEYRCDVSVDSGDSSNPITGTITLQQETVNDPTTFTLDLSGFNTQDSYTTHGFHIHEFGDLGNGCVDAGGHYNPENVNHAGPEDATRHVGDLGNIEEDGNGRVNEVFTDTVVKLSGDTNVLGRAIVIHEKNDDLGLGGDAGSLATGNAGGRIACCVITNSGSNISSNLFIALPLFIALAIKNYL